jgi:hypothetical protein
MSKIQVNAIEPQCGTTLTVGASGDTILIPSGATISNQGTAAGFGPTGAVSWNTTKITANPNPAVTGVGYFADTTSAAFTITLPATPAAGAVVGICDYANTFATNNLTVGRNGSNIGGSAANATLSTSGVSVTFVYVDATQGWIVTDSGNRSDLPAPLFMAATGGCIATCGNFKIHTFTGPGTFTVTSGGNSAGSNSVDYLVVAGGGGGGSGPDNGGAGGAGGFRLSNSLSLPAPTTSPLASSTAVPVSVTAYPITVGSGGAGAPRPGGGFGTSGVPSVFSTITSTGGGGGGFRDGPPVGDGAGLPGGSGGGGGNRASTTGAGGTGNTPPVSPSQGNPGGTGQSDNSSYSATGGGGGAGAAGTNGIPSCNGNGGVGSYVSPSFAASYGTTGPVPAVRYFAGGGGGGNHPAVPAGGTGGSGGGGTGGKQPGINAIAGTVNTGGGGGGGASGTPSPANSGASGGSGIVLIRYRYQ